VAAAMLVGVLHRAARISLTYCHGRICELVWQPPYRMGRGVVDFLLVDIEIPLLDQISSSVVLRYSSGYASFYFSAILR
jgi:hypothetical protein